MERTSNFRKDIIDPIQFMKGRGWLCDHITLDDTIKPCYYIIRQQKHDGTMLFTYQILENTLLPLVNKESYCKKDSPDLKTMKDIKYTITMLRMATIWGQGLNPSNGGFGQRERTRVGVKCEYIY